MPTRRAALFRLPVGNDAARLAGILLAIAGFVFLMGVITAEAEYPHPYTTHENEISDLGATRPPGSISHQPSAAIFIATCLAVGAAILAAGVLLRRANAPRREWLTVGLLGLGVLGVGVFPGNMAPFHGLFAMLAFVSGGLAGVLAGTTLLGAFRYVSIALGSIALGNLLVAFLSDLTPVWDELGDGGVERWIAYPVVLWLVAFGSFVAGSESRPPFEAPAVQVGRNV
ncbi:MAG: DUF998 domain-containing protein [Dehalococcoidia bacterium]